MTENKREEEQTLEQLENTVEVSTNSLRTAMTPLGKLPEWQRQNRLEQAIKDTILDLQGVVHDLELRRPSIVVTESIPHPCDNCQVTLSNLDPDEHCHGCDDELKLASFVPKELRYADPTEASLEDDEP